MRSLLSLAMFTTCLFATENAQAVLTLQIEGNGLSFTLEDGGAGDIDTIVNGTISIDIATAGIGGTWGGGTKFLVTANNTGSNLARGQLNVMADYDLTGGPTLATPIRVSTSDLLTVAGAPIDFWTHSISTTASSVASLPFTNSVTNSQGFFTTSYQNGPGPLDPFDFVNPDSYQNSVTIAPPTLPAAPFSSTVFGPAPIGATTFPGSGVFTSNFGQELRIANTFTVAVSGFGGADIGTVSSSTIVNPEPASLLLSGLGAAVFGFGYRRRKQAESIC